MLGFSPLSGVPFSSLSGKTYNVTISESATAADQELYSVSAGGLLTETGTGNDAQYNTMVSTSLPVRETTRTNLYKFSEQFDLWGQTNTTIAVNQAADPVYGTTTVDYITNTPNLNSALTAQTQQYPYQAGQTYTKSVYAKAITGSPNLYFQAIPTNYNNQNPTYFVTNFNLSTGTIVSNSGGATSTITSLGGGWYRCTQTFTAPSYVGGGSGGIIAGDSIFIGGYGSTSLTTTIALWGAQLEQNTAVSTYVNSEATGESSSNSGVLAVSDREYVRKNLLPYSDDITVSSSWRTVQATLTPSQLDPNGTNTAFLWTENALGGVDHYTECFNLLNLNTALTYNWSTYLKNNGRNTIILSVINSNTANYFSIQVNLATGVLSVPSSGGTGTYLSSSISNEGNGWYRVSITGISSSVSSGSFYATRIQPFNTSSTYTGDGTSGVYIWHPQFEYNALTTYVSSEDPNTYTTALAFSGIQPEIATTNLVSESQSNYIARPNTTIISTTEIAPDGTPTAVRVRLTAAYGGIRAPGNPWLHDTQLTGSAWVKIDTGTRPLTFFLNGGGAGWTGTFTATSTWTRYSTTYTKSGYNYNDIFCIGDAGASGYVDIIIWGIQVEVGATASAYQVKPIVESNASQVAFAPQITETGTGADSQFNIATFNPKIFEVSRANYVRNAYDMTLTPWTYPSMTVTKSGAVAAPDGSFTAYKPVANSGVTIFFNLAQGLPNTSGSSGIAQTGYYYTLSVYAKAGEYNYLKLYVFDNASYGAFFDLTNGTVAGSGGVTTNVTSVGGGWYRCSITRLCSTDLFNSIFIMGTPALSGSYTGDGTSGIYIWHPQFEQGSTATTYIDSDNTDSLVGGFSAPVALTETGTGVDSQFNITTRLSDVTETGTANNTQNQLVTALRDVTETGTGADSQYNTFITAPQLITESGTAADTPLLGNYSTTQLLTESGTGSDSQYNISTRLADVTESSTAANTENRTITALRDITETGSLTELAMTGYPWVADLTETGTASATENRSYSPGGLLTETGSSADSQFNIATRLADITETNTAAETQFNISVRLGDITETSTSGDAQFNIITRVALLTETNTAADNQFNIATRLADVTETNTSADSQYNTFITAPQLITETGTAANTENRALLALRDVTETGTANETESNLVAFLTQITETGTANQTETQVVLATRNITETNTSTDSQYNTAIRLADLIESITATELNSVQTAFISAIQEALTAIDSGISNKITTSSISEIVSALDSPNRFAFYAVNTTELLNALVDQNTGVNAFITETGSLSTIELANLLVNRGVLETLNANDSEFNNVVANSYITEISVAGESTVVWVFFPMDYELVSSRYSSNIDVIGDEIYVDNIDVFYMDDAHMFADVSLSYDQIYIDNIDVLYGNIALIDAVLSDEIHI